MNQRRDFQRLRVVQSLFEAQRTEALLESEGIECMVVSYADTALDGLYQAHKGWGELRVPAADRQRAEELVRNHLAEAITVADEELEHLATSAAAAEPAETMKGNRLALVVLALALLAMAAGALWLLFGD